MVRPQWSQAPRKWRATWLLCAAWTAAAMLSTAAQAQPASVVGGPGGAAFADQPPGGVRLGAVALRTGELIDAIAAVVVRPDGQRIPLQLHGGPGGAPRVFALQDGEHLIAMRVWSGQIVEAVQFETNRRQSPVYGNPRSAMQRLVVPPGAEVVGFVGRAGLYVDALGFALQRQSVAQHSGGAANTPAADPKHPAPLPAPAVSRVELDGPVRHLTPTQSSLSLQVRLKQPALLTVNLGTDAPRSGPCFGPQDRGVIRYVSARAEVLHVVTFSGLQKGSNYHYSIPLYGGKCVNDIASTRNCMHGGTC